MKTTEISKQLEEARPVWAEIRLDRLKANLDRIRRSVPPGTGVIAVVKADAYGHGAARVAEALVRSRADMLAVAALGEAVKLRQEGIQAPVLVLGPLSEEMAETAAEYRITPSISHLSTALRLSEIAQRKGERCKVHVRVDVSAAGLGVSVKEAVSFIGQAAHLQGLELEGIYAHLHSAYGDDPQVRQAELHKFEHVLEQCRQRGLCFPIVHAASSPAVLTMPEASYDMVRPGILLYGLPAWKGQAADAFEPVMQLKARISALKEVVQGAGFGYGYRYTLGDQTVLAAVPLGYADAAFLFHWRNGEVLVRGRKAALVGRVYMDHFMVDVSHIPDVQIGDEVVIFGVQRGVEIRAEETAMKAGVGRLYGDFACLLSPRVPRVYVSGN